MLNKAVLVLLVFCAMSSLGANKNSRTHPGEISGVVLTEDDLPAINFQVCTQVESTQSGFRRSKTCCSTTTDSEGRFTLKNMKPGAYKLLATNDAEGYPLNDKTLEQAVTVDKKKVSTSVTIRLGERSPVVVAHISDKNTGKPLNDALLDYSGIDCQSSGNVLVGVEGDYALPVPADCDVAMIARAKGYKGWVYTDAQSPSRPVLRLSSGQRKILNIELEPIGDQVSQR